MPVPPLLAAPAAALAPVPLVREVLRGADPAAAAADALLLDWQGLPTPEELALVCCVSACCWLLCCVPRAIPAVLVAHGSALS
jgi:hypothetical protein